MFILFISDGILVSGKVRLLLSQSSQINDCFTDTDVSVFNTQASVCHTADLPRDSTAI